MKLNKSSASVIQKEVKLPEADLCILLCIYIIVKPQNPGVYKTYNPKARAVVPERGEGATKALRVINFVDSVGFEV